VVAVELCPWFDDKEKLDNCTGGLTTITAGLKTVGLLLFDKLKETLDEEEDGRREDSPLLSGSWLFMELFFTIRLADDEQVGSCCC
jgi:hypothetical protein